MIHSAAPRTARGPRLRRTTALAAVLCLAAGVTAACGATTSTGSGSGTTITLYNAQHEQTTDAMIQAFTAQTGIKVRVDNDDEDVLTAQIEQEGSKSPADVIYTENVNWLQQLDQQGLLAKADSSTLAAVPSQDNSADGTWAGVSARVSVLVYNPSKISAAQLPTSIMQMADPKYKGEFEIAPGETDFWPLIDSIAKTYGQTAALNWLQAVKANAGSGDNVPDNETLTSDVNQGVTDFAVINHYYYYRLEGELGAGAVHAKLAYFAPKDPGYVEDISGAAVLKSSKNSAAAQKFLAFLTSEAGQTVMEHGESFEYPLRAGVAANPLLPPLSSMQPCDFTPADLGTGLTAKTLLQQAGLL
jgi:iron(III) transport system substrate-binding protein